MDRLFINMDILTIPVKTGVMRLFFIKIHTQMLNMSIPQKHPSSYYQELIDEKAISKFS